jgi:hypothetical protein
MHLTVPTHTLSRFKKPKLARPHYLFSGEAVRAKYQSARLGPAQKCFMVFSWQFKKANDGSK